MMRVNVSPQTFKQLNRLMVLWYRLGLGGRFEGSRSGYVMVLGTLGRRSGLRRRTPVNYAVINGDVYCTAGFGASSDWYRNLQANPQVEVWLPDSAWVGQAETVADPQEALPLLRQVWINSGFAAKLFTGIDPRTASDEELRAVSDGAPVVRILLEERFVGREGPGDLVWVWPLVGVALLGALWLARRLRRRLSLGSG